MFPTQDQLRHLTDILESKVNDEHGKFDDHYLAHEDCPAFDRIEWLRDVAAQIKRREL